ncbi:HAMP domain-containing protein, partial [Clostridium perfringens]
TGLTVILSIMAALFGFLRIARPIERMTAAMKVLAAGDAGVAIPCVGRRDEIGAMADAVGIFRDNLIRTRRLEEETRAARL